MLDIRRPAVGLALTACLAASSGLAATSALAATAPASARTAAAPAVRTPAVSAPATTTRAYHSWRAAQRAAGFSLVRPSRTYGLKRVAPIAVQRCAVHAKSKKRNVFVSYGSTGDRLIAFVQNNSGKPCGKAEMGRPLGRYRVHNVTAHLAGICGVAGQPSCSSRDIFLLLTWKRHGIYFQVVSHDVRRGTIVGFARGLRFVG